MSAPAKCPLCGTKLQPDWESCPNCPMSFTEKSPEKSALQNDNFRNFGIPLLLFGGLAYVMWAFSQYMWNTAESSTHNVAAIAQQAAGSPAAVVKGAGVVPTNSKAIQGLVNEQVTGQFNPDGDAPPETKKAGEEDEGPGTISIMPDKRAKTKVVSEWRMRGAIYDLITLKPVAGVRMIFTDNQTNSKAQIQSDVHGNYRAILPALPGRGYLVTLSKPGYEKAYLDPGTEGVAEMPEERRREIAKELSSLIAEPASLQPNSDTPLVTDFHIAPK